MDNLSKKKKVKKPKMARKPRTKKASDKKPSQYVNVNVTSSGGGGSGGASIPSAQPLSSSFINQSSQAEREANRGLLNRLDQLLKKQDDISPLVKSLEKQPDNIMIKEELVEELKNEDEIQNKVESALTSGTEDPKYVRDLRKKIKKLGGDKPPYKTSITDLEKLVFELSQNE